jgi:hypothetical protein
MSKCKRQAKEHFLEKGLGKNETLFCKKGMNNLRKRLPAPIILEMKPKIILMSMNFVSSTNYFFSRSYRLSIN